METLTALLRDLAGFVISPMVWGLLGLGLALLLLWRGRVVAARRVLVVLLAGGLIVTSLPLGWPVIAAREADHAVAPAPDAVDGIILLGGAERPAISAHWQRAEVNEAADRVIAAAMLAHRFPDIPVIVTGGHGQTRADGTVVPGEAEISARILTGLGIEPARLILEDRARNTRENAQLAFERAGRSDHDPTDPDARWLLVTSGFHMTRALAEFERAGWQGLVPYPVDFRTTTWRDALGWRPYGNMAMLEAALHEALGRLALRLGLP